MHIYVKDCLTTTGMTIQIGVYIPSFYVTNHDGKLLARFRYYTESNIPIALESNCVDLLFLLIGSFAGASPTYKQTLPHS